MNSQVPRLPSRGVGLQSQETLQRGSINAAGQSVSEPSAKEFEVQASLGWPLATPASVASDHWPTPALAAVSTANAFRQCGVAQRLCTGAKVRRFQSPRRTVAQPKAVAPAQRSTPARHAGRWLVAINLSVAARHQGVCAVVSPSRWCRRWVTCAHLTQGISSVAAPGVAQKPQPNLTLKRNANSAARRPSSAGPCGPFCARCPTRHAVGVRLALR